MEYIFLAEYCTKQIHADLELMKLFKFKKQVSRLDETILQLREQLLSLNENRNIFRDGGIFVAKT